MRLTCNCSHLTTTSAFSVFARSTSRRLNESTLNYLSNNATRDLPFSDCFVTSFLAETNSCLREKHRDDAIYHIQTASSLHSSQRQTAVFARSGATTRSPTFRLFRHFISRRDKQLSSREAERRRDLPHSDCFVTLFLAETNSCLREKRSDDAISNNKTASSLYSSQRLVEMNVFVTHAQKNPPFVAGDFLYKSIFKLSRSTLF